MCAITGVVSFRNNADYYKENLIRATDILKHRGPDGEGYYFYNRVGLGHRRLAIIDLYSGNQPIFNETLDVVIVFNGEIYNFLELRAYLRKKGHIFTSNTDTEVLVHLYEEKGVELINDLEGMFAFAIYDKNRDLLFLARDHFGIKPLYYKLDSDKFIFASEIKSILEFENRKGELDPQSLIDYITFQYVLEDRTLFKNIKKVLPGEYIIIQRGKLTKKIYWKPSSHKIEKDEKWFVNHFKDLLQSSVKRQLVSDVPVGFHLSGGVDTATIVGIAKQIHKNKTQYTFSTSFKDFESEESKLVYQTSTMYSTKHHNRSLNERDFMDILPKIIWYLDEPLGDPGIVAQYYTNLEAAKKTKVVLTGHGADEILAGYIRHLLFYADQAFKDAIFGKTECQLSLADLKDGLPYLSDYNQLISKYYKDGFNDEPINSYMRLVSREYNARKILSKDYQNLIQEYSPVTIAARSFNDLVGNGDILDNVLLFDLQVMLPPLLMMEDRASMANSIESRVPFLTPKFVEFAFQVPTWLKLNKGIPKYLLREAFKDLLPNEVRTRKRKVGRPVPIHLWLKDKKFNNFIYEIVCVNLKKRGIFDNEYLKKTLECDRPYDRQLWSLICIELWHEQFID